MNELHASDEYNYYFSTRSFTFAILLYRAQSHFEEGSYVAFYGISRQSPSNGGTKEVFLPYLLSLELGFLFGSTCKFARNHRWV